MTMKKSKFTWFATLAVTAVLFVSALSLAACGGSSDNSASTSSSSSSTQQSTSSSSDDTSSTTSDDTSSTTSDDTSSTSSSSDDTSSTSSSSSLTLDDVEAAMTSGYMGVNEDSGETYYWASNDDGSLVMLAVLNTNNGAENATSASYVGNATVNGNNVVVTDYVTGNQIGFDVTNNGDGTVTLDLGDEYGQATLGQCEVSEVFNAFKTIDQYTTAVK